MVMYHLGTWSFENFTYIRSVYVSPCSKGERWTVFMSRDTIVYGRRVLISCSASSRLSLSLLPSGPNILMKKAIRKKSNKGEVCLQRTNRRLLQLIEFCNEAFISSAAFLGSQGRVKLSARVCYFRRFLRVTELQ